MKKIFLSALLMLSCMTGFCGDSLKAERLNGTILMDGRLEEPAWKTASAYTKFYKAGTMTPALGATEIRVLYTHNALYLGIRCNEPAMNEVVCRDTPRDGGIYQSDCLEIMLDPAVSKERYYHFMTDLRGQQYDAYRDQGGGVQYPQWNGSWTAKSFKGKDFWSCEIRIPFFNFTEKNSISGDWGINVCRGKRTNPREDSSITGEYHKVDKFLPLKGIDADLSSYRLEVTPPAGKISLGGRERIFVENTAAVGNHGARELTLLADSWLTAPDGNVFTSPQTRIVMKPGEVKTVSLPKIEIRKQGQYRNALRITDSDGRILAYRDAAQNIHFSPINIRLFVPWYRHSIFETQKIKDIEFRIQTGMEPEQLNGKILEVAIGNSEKRVWSTTVKEVKPSLDFKVDHAKIPFGRYQISAVLKDQNGKKVDFCSAEFPLWKLPYKPSETWRGKDGNWYVEGKPVFINSFWARKEFEQPEHNVVMMFQDQWKQMASGKYSLSGNVIFGVLKKPGMLKALQSGNLDETNLNHYRECIRKDRDIPNLFGYYLADEPSTNSTHVDALNQAYETIKSEDPYHPVIISDSSRNEYITACDINAHHPYPTILRHVKANDCTSIVSAFDSGKLKLGNGYHQVSFIFMDMGFNKWDFGLGDKDGRIASFQEYRDHMLMALACDMKGLLPFNSECWSYPEALIGFPAIAKEGASLGQAVISPDTVFRPKADYDKIRLISKNLNGNTVIIASNVSMTPRKVTFHGLPADVRSVNVISENRSIPVKDGSFSDQFQECQGHAYTTGPAPKLEPVNSINSRIDKAWAEIAKPGNLLFQRYRDDTVKVTASSIFVNYGMAGAETALWHLCDGYFPANSGGYGLLFWSSAAGKLPAWIQFEPKKAPFLLGRVVVYPLEKSVKAMNVELFTGGQWKKVYETADASALDRIECRFAPEKTTKFRINILSLNEKQKPGKGVLRARIGEVEAYEK